MIYLDTSALLKRYVPEANSDIFDNYFVGSAPFLISQLVLVELRCTLARKRRNKEIAAGREKAAMGEVRTDIQDGLLVISSVADTHFSEALHLMDALPKFPLRSLDAIHLAIANSHQTHEIATADNIFRQAAQALQIKVAYFGT